jgi:hypothetical protein
MFVRATTITTAAHLNKYAKEHGCVLRSVVPYHIKSAEVSKCLNNLMHSPQKGVEESSVMLDPNS